MPQSYIFFALFESYSKRKGTPYIDGMDSL